MRRAWGSARKHKRLQGGEPRLVVVDGFFQRLHITRIKSGLAARITANSCGELCAKIEELALNARQQSVDVVVINVRSEDADAAVQFVDLAVCMNSLVGL